MRRDICYYFAADVKSVYSAYLAAAMNPQFRRSCNQQPYHTFSFGLNFSMKYNMNGGSCTLHFIPYQGGTAVDLRFSIAQLAGARYKKYAEDLTNATVDVLRIPAQPITLDINVFLDERNKIHADNTPNTFTKTPVPPVSMQTKVCKNCGVSVGASDTFCQNCGARFETLSRFCSNCGNPTEPNAHFCAKCGNKLM